MVVQDRPWEPSVLKIIIKLFVFILKIFIGGEAYVRTTEHFKIFRNGKVHPMYDVCFCWCIVGVIWSATK